MTGAASGPAGAPTGTSRRVVVFACGDALRGDDSVAGLAVASLPPHTRSAADVRSVGALESEELIELDPERPVVVVDAVVGVDVGRVIWLDLADLADRAAAVVACSSHQVPLDRVIGLAGLLRDAPVRGRFVGLGIGGVDAGAMVSPLAAAAIPALRDAIQAAVEELAAGPGPLAFQPDSR